MCLVCRFRASHVHLDCHSCVHTTNVAGTPPNVFSCRYVHSPSGDGGSAMRTHLISMLLFGLALNGCQTVPKSQIPGRMYDACQPHLSNYMSKPDHKYMVAGVSGSRNRCYWNWSKATWLDARRVALKDCEDAGNQECWQYATNNTLQPFVHIVEGQRAERAAARNRAANTRNQYRARSSATPARSVSGQGGGGQACFDRRQNDISARFISRVNAAAGICQQGTVSRDMWQAVLEAAAACNMPEATRSYIRSNFSQSRQTMQNSCAR